MSIKVEWQDPKSGEWIEVTPEEDAPAKPALMPRLALAIAALTTTAAAAAGLHADRLAHAPHPVRIGALSPTAARLALTHGLSCKLVSVNDPGKPYFDASRHELMQDQSAVVDVAKTPAYEAALSQYAESPAVMWDASLDLEMFSPTNTHPVMNNAYSYMHELTSGDWPDFGNTLTAPTVAVRAGLRFGVALHIDVVSDDQRTAAEVPCGVMIGHDGLMQLDSSATLQGSAVTTPAPRHGSVPDLKP